MQEGIWPAHGLSAHHRLQSRINDRGRGFDTAKTTADIIEESNDGAP